MTTVYESSIPVLIKNVVYGVCGGIVAAIIVNFFLPAGLAVAIGAILGILIIYFALVKDNIRVVLTDDTLSFYNLGKLKHEFKLDEVGFSARIKTSDGDSDCTLTVHEAEDKETYIDCSMLGRTRFYELLDALHVTDPEPVAVETVKKEK